MYFVPGNGVGGNTDLEIKVNGNVKCRTVSLDYATGADFLPSLVSQQK